MIQVQEIDALIPQEMTAGLRPEAITVVLANIAVAARNHWIRLASDDPSSFRDDYIDGIQDVSVRPGTAVIALVGEVPNMLEDGRTNEDMRDFLLGPEVPVTPVGERGKHRNAEGGYYRAIPIRHMTPGARQAAMGSAYTSVMAEADAKKLGQEVYKAAKALASLMTAPGGEKAYGGEPNQPRRLPAGVGGAMPLKHHKTDIYAGMIREEKVYGPGTKGRPQAQYFTFRTISTSVKEGWFRTIPARHFAQKVADFASREAPKAFRAYLESVVP